MLGGEATNINLMVFGLTRLGLEPTIYHTRSERDNHYTTDVAPHWRTFLQNEFSSNIISSQSALIDLEFPSEAINLLIFRSHAPRHFLQNEFPSKNINLLIFRSNIPRHFLQNEFPSKTINLLIFGSHKPRRFLQNKFPVNSTNL